MKAEQNNYVHFDYLDLLTLVKSGLSYEYNKKDEDYKQEEYTALLSGNYLRGKAESSYLSPLSLLDKESLICYPIFFLKLREKNNNFYYDGTLLIINEFAKKILKSVGIDLSFLYNGEKLCDAFMILDSSLDTKKLRHRFEVRYHRVYSSENSITANTLFPLIDSFIAGNKLPKRFLGLSSYLLDNAVEKKIDKTLKNSFFSESYRSMKRCDNYGGSRVSYHNDFIRTDYLNRFFSNALLKNKRILLILPDNDSKNQTVDFLKENNLFSISRDFNDIEPSLLPVLKREISLLSIDDKKALWNVRENEQRYLGLGRKRNEAFGYLTQVFDNDVYKALESPAYTYDLDVSDYKYDDYNADRLFLSSLDKYPSVLLSSLNKHPYFGLTVTSKRENYDTLLVTLIRCQKQLKAFRSLLLEKEVTDFSLNEIDNFKSFENYSKNIQVLSGYNGFPRKYFKIESKKEEELSLKGLKTMFQAVSSTRLLIGDLCISSIYQANLQEIMNDYNKGGFFAHRKAKKLLISYMKAKKHPDIKTLTRILNTYLNALTLLREKMPLYIQVYGDTVKTMNGVVEIESNTAYLHEFNQRSKEDSAFNLDNPLIKKALRDKEFRLSLIKDCQELDAQYLALKKSINAYIGFFADEKNPFMDMKFDEIKQIFIIKNAGRYSEFRDYSDFNRELQKASVLLQLTVRKYLIEERGMKDFKNEYLSSLFNSIYKDGKSKFDEFQDHYQESRIKYQAGLHHLLPLERNYRLSQINKLISSDIKTSQFSDLYQRVRHEIKEGRMNKETLDDSYSIYSSLYPITYVTIDNIGHVPSECYDLALLFDSKKADALHLMGCINAVKEVIFFNHHDDNDLRIQGYPEVMLSKANIFGKYFSYSSLPTDLVNDIEKEFEKKKHHVVLDDTRFPICVTDSKKEHTFAFLPDVLIPEKLSKETRTELREYLVAAYNLDLMILDTFAFAFNPEKEIDSLLSDEEKIYKIHESTPSSELIFTKEDPEVVYLKEIKKIKKSFSACLTREKFEELISKYQFEEAFYGIQPVKISVINSINDEKFNSWLEDRINVGLVCRKDGFYMDVSLSEIKFHVSDKSIRTIDEVSETEMMQGMKAFIFNFDYFDEEELRSVMAGLLGYDTDDSEFNLHFDDTVNVMLDKKLVRINGDRLSIRVD